MTKKEIKLQDFVHIMHDSGDIWTISSAFNFYESHGYSKSKRTFERELENLKFKPEIIFEENNPNLKKIVYKGWQDLISRKRYLSLKSSILKFNNINFIFYEDNRGKKYWYGIKDLNDSEILNSTLKLLRFINHSAVIWPSKDLIDIFSSVVKYVGTESVIKKNKIKAIFPITSFKKLLNKKDLTQKNKYFSKKIISKHALTHIDEIEAESIHIIRETIAEAKNPVMLYSVGKDSAVMLHLAKKAFYPAPPPFPLLHVDTGWKFDEMYQFRNLMAKLSGMELLIYKNEEGINLGINPFDHGSEIHTDIMKTQALKKALDKYEFDFAFGGARRDEEKSRAKERILSFRSDTHSWDPKNQRPELWDLYNFEKKESESARVFPISNWTEFDIWQYIYRESIPIVPLYFSAERPCVERDGVLFMVDDDRFKLYKNEEIKFIKIRFRTLGCYPLTAAVKSDAAQISDILLELIQTKSSERSGRIIDSDSAASMEQKKKEGYF